MTNAIKRTECSETRSGLLGDLPCRWQARASCHQSARGGWLCVPRGWCSGVSARESGAAHLCVVAQGPCPSTPEHFLFSGGFCTYELVGFSPLLVPFLKSSPKDAFSYVSRERGRGREEHQLVASERAPAGDPTCSPGVRALPGNGSRVLLASGTARQPLSHTDQGIAAGISATTRCLATLALPFSYLHTSKCVLGCKR